MVKYAFDLSFSKFLSSHSVRCSSLNDSSSDVESETCDS
ncbi:predicted protein [Sclerotinia sclerotiorum 1980 UF-70]|uniref:Uncharacterized protein n=1 Tax=Sclerotinia sclerotiorum (strain ATCC 18683 / 1980 / Ss-1) TaxID=665079 RepID=A7E609_SCLS1|nr:predicted protein [Sclerotinia sclerotiorum 1980 UF-70]EDN91331.1 predicted protein [Sclerotinia sclerotiorum 1980 UF-70]